MKFLRLDLHEDRGNENNAEYCRSDEVTGAFSRGGLITLLGNAGRRVGAGMCGGEIVVKGSIGSQAAMEMTAGTLLIFGNAGAMLGQDMLGGTIYLRGKAASLAPQLEECRLKEADRLRIGLLLLKSGVQGDARDFRVLKVVGG